MGGGLGGNRATIAALNISAIGNHHRRRENQMRSLVAWCNALAGLKRRSRYRLGAGKLSLLGRQAYKRGWAALRRPDMALSGVAQRDRRAV